MDPLVAVVSDHLGLSRSVSRFLVAYAGSIPLSYVFRFLPGGSPTATFFRHVYSAASGLLLTYLAFGIGSFPLIFVPVIVAYLAMLVLPQHCGNSTFFLTMTFLIGCHVWLMSGDAWREGGIDCTGALMILTLKAISITIDCQDGVRHRHKAAKQKEQSQEADFQAAGRKSVLESEAHASTVAGGTHGASRSEGMDTDVLKKENGVSPAMGPDKGPPKHALETVPSIVELLGYSFCCGLHFAGPFYFYGDYRKWIECKEDFSWLINTNQRQPPFLLRLLRALGQAGLAAVVYLWLDSLLDVSIFFSPTLYLSLPVWRRVLLLYLAGTVTRWKYYFIWSISEAAMVTSGLGFSGWKREEGKGGKGSFQEVASWERAENCHVLGVELASSAALFAVNWNISVGRWLRAYVYERLVPAGKKPKFIHLLITQLVAGVWHGLYPGYILFFSGIAWEVAGSRVLYKWEKKIPEGMVVARALAKLAHGLYAAFCNNFFAVGFIVLTAKDTLAAWAGVYYAGVILPGAFMALDMLLPKGRTKKSKEA